MKEKDIQGRKQDKKKEMSSLFSKKSIEETAYFNPEYTIWSVIKPHQIYQDPQTGCNTIRKKENTQCSSFRRPNNIGKIKNGMEIEYRPSIKQDERIRIQDKVDQDIFNPDKIDQKSRDDNKYHINATQVNSNNDHRFKKRG
ncbi:hypothetical protein AYI68_g581 [Smittium mucronatum]|uniref:Uncharacterized protein n=1 Tax=Smittium mucronatum TaxID=133383 RepID=A0A1R0H831_9FUNG|nr:hypothetical protein AYI68_g581 [Smittium mucronatum]